MTQKEKADSLVKEYFDMIGSKYYAKRIAISCVEEVIHALDEKNGGMHNFYWSEVKEEINKI